MQDWVSFWDSDHPIYVNARHFDVHYRAIADDIIALIPSPSAQVLDHGCGEALHAGRIAARCTGSAASPRADRSPPMGPSS